MNKWVLYKFIIAIFLIAVPHLYFAQNNTIKFTRISLKEGLSQSTVNSILQDKRGFMWFATQDGLNRYDGYTFTVFKHSLQDTNSISDNFIHAIVEDIYGNIWAATDAGLNSYNPETGRFTRYLAQPYNKNWLGGNTIHALAADKNGNIWVGTADAGLYYFDVKAKLFKAYKSDYSDTTISSNAIQCLYIDKNENLWIGTVGGGLNLFDSKNKKFKVYQESATETSISNNLVWSVFEDSEGFIWIGTNNGLNRFDTKMQTFKHYKNKPGDIFSLSNNIVKSILEDNQGNIWVATTGGLNKLNKATGTFTRFQYQPYIQTSLSNDNLFSLYQDRTGNMWVGTNKGICKFDNAKQNFIHYRNIPYEENSINNDVIWSIYQDSQGILWVGTEEGLNKIDRKLFKVKHFKHGASKRNSKFNEYVFALFEDSDGVLWLGTDGGIYSFNKLNETFTLFKTPAKDISPLEDKRVYTIFEDTRKNLWIGTKEGLYIIDKSRKKIKHFVNNPSDSTSISNNIIRTIIKDKNNTIWIGTNGGGLNKAIVVENEGDFTVHFKAYQAAKGGLNNNIILSIYEDKNGFFWIGTYGGGLNKFDPSTGSAEAFTEKNGLSNNVVYGVYSDSNENLWMSTNKGISMFNPHKRQFINYYENDGLQSNEFNIGAHYQSKKGELFFGGINGLNSFFPDKISINTIPPQVVLTDFQIINKHVYPGENSPLKKSISETEELILSYKDDVITFEFAALHYTSPEANRYAYMMEGFDEGWNYVDTRRQASYTNLDPGTYTFRVKASNSDGIWNEDGVKLTIIITPPFWMRWWFRITFILGIIGIIFYFYRIRINHINSQKKYLEKLVRERTLEIVQQNEKIRKQNELLAIEKEKVEKLLLNILPQETVEELKSKGKASPRSYRMASVMFTDFKGFTQRAESMRPQELVDALDRYFIKFDEIIMKYGLEKIKTIGDSYMCVGGVPIRNRSNPIDIVLAALEIQRFMKEMQQESIAKGEKPWELRIGINTGEIIAGVIGIKRFAYDIWGDTVNVASRMEMQGEVGKVNISGATYQYIKDYFECTYRGKVPAKNKGEIDMYFVERIRTDLSVNGDGITPNENFKALMATNLYYRINYKKAEQFILKKLERELPKDLYYHGLHHTIDVRDAAERIGKAEGVEGEDMHVLKTAAMFHDAGFVKQYFKNEPIGVEMCKEILPQFGYSPEQIKAIEKMIMATQIPQRAQTLLEKIICDADLDYLGREEDFFKISDTLKMELMARGKVSGDKEWDAIQIAFLEKHQYFTDYSKKYRQPIKEKHLEMIKKRYAEDKYTS
jgi:ligand-binding sensor domain-containing protein/class 3 adenylate cyclase/predicted metal-dependent HD superfamily phosphohydrolase